MIDIALAGRQFTADESQHQSDETTRINANSINIVTFFFIISQNEDFEAISDPVTRPRQTFPIHNSYTFVSIYKRHFYIEKKSN